MEVPNKIVSVVIEQLKEYRHILAEGDEKELAGRDVIVSIKALERLEKLEVERLTR